MDIKEFSEFVERHSFKTDDPFWSMNALVGELGEVANVLKKQEYHKHMETYQKKVKEEIEAGIRKPFREQTVDELGDTLFFFIQTSNACGISMEEVMKYQFEKLTKQSEEAGKIYKK